eukprot:c17219_g1_i1 orf=464-781(+)
MSLLLFAPSYSWVLKYNSSSNPCRSKVGFSCNPHIFCLQHGKSFLKDSYAKFKCIFNLRFMEIVQRLYFQSCGDFKSHKHENAVTYNMSWESHWQWAVTHKVECE